MRVLLSLFLVGFLASSAAAQPTARLYVHAGATGANNGSTWENAFTSLDAAIAASAGTFNPIEVWVAGGPYRPAVLRLAGDPRSATFRIPGHVQLFGGFLGTESQLSDRLPGVRTILDGDLGVAGVATDNAYNVLSFEVPVLADWVLDGFRVTNGNATGAGEHNSAGGGLYMRVSGSPIPPRLRIRDCEFVGNGAVAGGGMYVVNANVELRDVAFRANLATSSGGGAWITGGGGPFTLRADDCDFRGNVSGGLGGGMYASAIATLVANSVFVGNEASAGGAMVTNDNAAQLFLCTIAFNLGGRSQGCGGVSAGGPLTVANCILVQNSDMSTSTDTQIEQLRLWPPGPNAVDSSLVSGWDGTLPGVDTTADEPLFFDPDGSDGVLGTADDNLRLLPGSPGIDSGANAQIPVDALDLDGDGDTAEPLPLDRDGNRRRTQDPLTADAPAAQRPVVDRGAYEYIPQYPAADANCDGFVTFDDIEAFVAALVGPEAYAAAYPDCFHRNADTDADGAVTFDDIESFVECLIGGGCD